MTKSAHITPLFGLGALALLPLGTPEVVSSQGAQAKNTSAYQLQSYVFTGEMAQPAFAWCDAKDRILALSQPQKALTTAQPVTLYNWSKRQLTHADTTKVQLGPVQAGAKHMSYKVRGQDKAKGNIQLSTVIDAKTRIQKVNAFDVGQGKNDCRHVSNAAFIGAGTESTVIVWDGKCDWSGLVCKATLATRHYNGRGDLMLRNGQTGYRNIARSGKDITDFTLTYSFENDKDDLLRVLEITNTGSTLTTRKNGQVVAIERMLAYSVSLPQK